MDLSQPGVGWIVSSYSMAPPSLKHSFLLDFVFILIWKINFKCLNKSPSKCTDIKGWDLKAALTMPHWKRPTVMRVPEEKLASPPRFCRMVYTFMLEMSRHDGCYFTGAIQPSAFPPKSTKDPVSLQACSPTHNHTEAESIYSFNSYSEPPMYEAMCWALETY